MTTAERDFSTYHLGDDVTKLAGGVVGELADVTGYQIEGNNPEELGALVGAIGADKVLRNNPQQTLREALPLERAADIVDQSGIQLPLNRSFRHPDIEMPLGEPIVITGAVANWQDRTAKLVADWPTVAGWPGSRVFMPTGNREMSSGTELRNPNIQQYMQFDALHPYPTEAEYASAYVRPRIEIAGHSVKFQPIDSGDGQEILNRFIADNEDLVYGRIGVARVANAGVQLAYQLRQAARQKLPEFDSVSGPHQLFMLTDTLPVARTDEELTDATHFQNPYTAMRQLALTAKLLAQAGFER